MITRMKREERATRNSEVDAARPITRVIRTIEPADLELLLGTEPGRLLGRIMQLNRAARYRNGLDAIDLAARILEMRRILMHQNDPRG